VSCPDPTTWTPDCDLGADVTVTVRGESFAPSPGTGGAPFVLLEFNPWGRTVRAATETARAWADGAWSGAEWTEAATIPLTILVRHPNPGVRGTRWWLPYQQRLAKAFAPSHTDIDLEFTVANPDTGGDTYLLRGRPRLVEHDAGTALRGWALARAAFRCLDPVIYSGGAAGLRSEDLGLPQSVGGLCAPFGAPFGVEATVAAGRVTITACGTIATGLQLTITGPCTDPRVTLLVPGMDQQVLRYYGALAAGQFLLIDTRARTALLNGTVSRRGLMSGDWFLLPPGDSELAFDAADYNIDAHLLVQWRDAWQA
jgi:hypothetical protein